MENPRASSRSRRSYPNLHNLSLAPLSAKYPLDASAPPSPSSPTHTPLTSYISHKSAPPTPGILSLSQSRSNSQTRRSKPIYAYDTSLTNTTRTTDEILPKAKSTSTLHAGVSFVDTQESEKQGHHTRKATAPLPLRIPLVRHHTASAANDEWFHRAGLAIAGETRDSKGQGWLVRRESSTSLVQDSPEHDTEKMVLLSGEHLHGNEYPTFSPRISRAGSRYQSRVNSRVPSTRVSRRGSRVGSRADLAMSSPVASRHSFDLPAFDSRFMEPDFVEADAESSGDEEEVARLARERGFGLGGWMDRLIGWSLFAVEEDGEGSSSEDEDTEEFLEANLTREEWKARREAETRRRKAEREAIIAASARNAHVDDAPPPPQEGDGWQDAAWLLSVASKALF
jgi:hypothetical protein